MHMKSFISGNTASVIWQIREQGMFWVGDMQILWRDSIGEPRS